MKQLIFTLLLLVSFTFSEAQVTNAFIENFDGPAAVQFNSVGTPGWATDANYWVSAPNCWRGQYAAASSTTTNSFSTLGNNFILLDFDQICKIEFTDTAKIEISTDNGVTWTKLDATLGTGNCIYNGTGNFIAQQNKFSEGSYFDWLPGQPTAPQNTWWKHEEFDISQLAGNQANVQVRFSLVDFTNNGMAGRYGWLLENVDVIQSPCELIAPTIHADATTYFATPILSDVYNLGPFDPQMILSDNSNCINGGDLFWSVNGGPLQQFGGMFNLQDSTWIGEFGPFNNNDTISWYATAVDCCGNTDTSQHYIFVCHDHFTLPYCDGFDNGTVLWYWDSINSTAGSTPWLQGVPNSGVLTTANSPTNVWACGLTGGYVNSSTSYLQLIPTLDFTGLTLANLSFWRNNNTETGWDGVRFEYSLDNVNWNILGDTSSHPPVAKNWYTNYINSSNLQAWDNNSNGWIKSSFKLGDPSVSPAIIGAPAVNIRFVFTSDPSVTRDGFDLDDFCIKIPCGDDLGLDAFVTPLDGTGVPAGGSLPVTVTVENFGTNPQSNFTVSYTTDGGITVQSTVVPGPLAPGATLDVILTPIANVLQGSDTVKAWTSLPGDCDLLSDTITITVVGIPTLPLTYCDDFENGNVGWSTQNDPTSAAGTNWEFGTPAFGQTTGANSGVTAWDINLNSAYTAGALCYLYSPFLDFSTTSNGRIKFSMNYNVAGFGEDGTYIQYTLDGSTWTSLGGLNDACGTNWYTANLFTNGENAWSGSSSTIPGNNNGWIDCSYKLCCAAPTPFNNPTPVQFRFVFSSWQFSFPLDGVSIDDFCVYSSTGDDVGISAIISPTGSVPAGASVPVIVTLENFGSTTVTSVPIEYTVNGVVVHDTTWVGSLAPCQSITDTLANFTASASGQDSIGVYTQYLGDIQLINDTARTVVIDVPKYTPTFCDNFDGANMGWSAQLAPGGDPATNWELGTPAFGATSSTNSGINAWDVNLTSAYTTNAQCYLYSPYFDFSQVSNGRITFATNYNTEANWDGTYLQYTVDAGSNWVVLGTGTTDPCGTNWYNRTLNITGDNAWSGNSGGWLNCSYKLCCASVSPFGNALPIQFRFVFHSDPSIVVDGTSIDDFCVYSSTGDDIGISAIISPSGGAPVGTPLSVVVTLENFGSTVITSTPIHYVVYTGQPLAPTAIGDTIWVGSLAPCQSITVTLPSFIAVAGQDSIVAYTQLPLDVQHSNDTSSTNLIGQPVKVVTYQFNYFDDFEGGNIGWAPSVDPAADPTTIWEFGDPNWASTTGAHSGTTAWDVNLNSAPSPNALTYVTTPYFDFTNAQAAVVRFWQNRSIYPFGDEFYLQYDVNGANNWTTLDINNGQVTTNWYNNIGFWDDVSGGWSQSVFKDIPSAIGTISPPSLVQFRFVYSSGQFFTNADGVSVDDFEIYVPIPLTVSPQAVNTSVPNQLIFPGKLITFASPVMNNGINPVFAHTITLTIDGTPVCTDPVSYVPSPLLSDSIATHNFTCQWTAVPGYHEVCTYTSMPNGTVDLSLWDDTVCTTVLVFDSVATSQYPYCNSFESGVQWVTANALSYRPKSTWQIGVPNQAFLNTAHTGSNVWSLSLDSNYLNRDSSGLFSSLFRVEPGHCYKLSFWQQFRMEYGSDGGDVSISEDYGNTWNTIDYTGIPGAVEFGPNTDYTYVAALNPVDPTQRGFTGNRNNWFKMEKTIRPDTLTQLIVRWHFASDFSGREEGWSIDDVCFEDLGVCVPLGIDEYAIADFGLSQNHPNPASDLTSIEYMIPTEGAVKIAVTNVFGQIVDVLVDGNVMSGKHTVDINTATYAAGIYSYTLTYNDKQITKRMVITK